MNKVSLINPNFQTGPVHLNSYYLPYTAGTLWAYCMADKRLADNFEINNWIFKRDDIDHAVKANFTEKTMVLIASLEYYLIMNHHTDLSIL